MLLVVDSNPLISLLISKGTRQDILFCDEIEPISPDWALFEIGKHWKEICSKSKFSEDDLNLSLKLVRERVKPFSLNEYSDKLGEAEEISPHAKDNEFFALALKLNCVIWSDEAAFKKQDKVEVFTSEELAKKFGLPWE
jgi:predicted nucleic acid-binding protein